MSPARVILSTGSLYLMDTAYCFQLAAETGFDGMEVMCDERFGTRDPIYLRKISQHYNLPILACHTPFSHHIPAWGKKWDEVGRIYHTLDLAATVGAEAMVVHLPQYIGRLVVQTHRHDFLLPWRSPFWGVKDWIEHDLPQVQAETPVKIAVENMPNTRLFGLRFDPTWWNEVESWGRVHTVADAGYNPLGHERN